jgi:hypothetical protein
MRYIPWMILGKGDMSNRNHTNRRASQTILLDYPNMWAPHAVWSAIKNRHYLVAAAITGSLLLRVEIALSTGLFSRLPVAVNAGNITATLKDSFVLQNALDLPELNISDYRPYALALGIGTANLSWPEGIMPGLAFQTFDFPSSYANLNITSMEADVDAVSVEVKCEETPMSGKWTGDFVNQFFVDAESSLCGKKFSYGAGLFGTSSHPDPYYWYYEDATPATGCSTNGSFFFASVSHMKIVDTTSLELIESVGVTCQVWASVGKRRAKRTTSGISILPGEARDVRPIGLDILEVMQYSRPIQKSEGGLRSWVSGGDTYIEDNMWLRPIEMGAYLTKGGPPPISEWFKPGVMKEIMQNFATGFGPMAVSIKARKSEQQLGASGDIVTNETRLVLQDASSQAMAAIFVLMIILSIPMALQSAPKDGIVPRDPNSISGMAVILANSRSVLSKLQGMGPSNLSALSRKLTGVYYTTVLQRPRKNPPRMFQLKHTGTGLFEYDSSDNNPEKTTDWFVPWTLLTSVWVAAIVILAILIVLLWVVLWHSKQSGGLVDIEGYAYSHFFWTVIPSLIFVGVSLYISSCDFDIRFLAPFARLAERNGGFKEALATTYTNELAPRILYLAAKNGNLGVLFSKTMAILASLMPIFSSNLFTLEETTRFSAIQLQQETWFASGDSRQFMPWAKPSILATMILHNNLSYPPWTYENLAFPTLSTVGLDNSGAAFSNSIRTTVPAMLVDYSCQTSYSALGNMTDMECRSFDNEYGSTCRGNRYFGYAASSCRRPSTNETIPAFMHYVWGECDGQTLGSGYKYSAVLSCTEKIDQVDVETTYTRSGSELRLDPNNPPVPDLKTVKATSITLGQTLMYNNLYPKSLPEDPRKKEQLYAFDPFFNSLIYSKFAVPAAHLTSEDTLLDVAKAIKQQHSVVRAQLLSSADNTRLSFNETSPITQERAERPAPISATLAVTRLRLVQQLTPSFILVGLLAAVILLIALSLFVVERKVVPKPPGSIAAIASLLADSTIFWHMPSGAEWMTDDELAEHFRRKTFRMDWFWANKGGGEPGRTFSIGILEDEGVAERHELEGDMEFRKRLRSRDGPPPSVSSVTTRSRKESVSDDL